MKPHPCISRELGKVKGVGPYFAMSWDGTVPFGAISWEKLWSWVGSPGLLLPEKSSAPASSCPQCTAVSKVTMPAVTSRLPSIIYTSKQYMCASNLQIRWSAAKISMVALQAALS